MKRRKLHFEPLQQRRLLAVYAPGAELPDGDPGSLRSAIADAQSNQQDDTIHLTQGVFRITQGDMLVSEVDQRLRIVGAGQEETVVVIEGDSRWLDVDF